MDLVQFDQIKSELAATPEIIINLLQNISNNRITDKPAGEAFSILENICHLRDIEVEGYNLRIKKILTEDQPVLPDIDGAQLAIDRKYQQQDLTSALNQFIAARRTSLALVADIKAADLNRTGSFENVGQITLAKLLLMMNEHDQVHLSELKQLVK